MIPSDDGIALPQIRYIMMWYKKKDGGAALKSVDITNRMKILVKECSRPLVYLLENCTDEYDETDDQESSFVLKLKTELLQHETNYVSVATHMPERDRKRKKIAALKKIVIVTLMKTLMRVLMKKIVLMIVILMKVILMEVTKAALKKNLNYRRVREKGCLRTLLVI